MDGRFSSVSELSSLIRNRRKSLGLTQVQAASLCGVGNRFFSELENGKETLHLGKVLHCMELLGLNLHAVSREDEP